MKEKLCKGLVVRENRKGSGRYFVVMTHAGQVEMVPMGKFENAVGYAKGIKDDFLNNPLATIEHHRRLKENPQRPTFALAATTWINKLKNETDEDKRKASSTVERYEQLLRDWVLPEFGSLKLEPVTNHRVKDLFRKLDKLNMSKSAMSNVSTVITGTVGFARNERWTDMMNPVTDILKDLGLLRVKKERGRQDGQKLQPGSGEKLSGICDGT